MHAPAAASAYGRSPASSVPKLNWRLCDLLDLQGEYDLKKSSNTEVLRILSNKIFIQPDIVGLYIWLQTNFQVIFLFLFHFVEKNKYSC